MYTILTDPLVARHATKAGIKKAIKLTKNSKRHHIADMPDEKFHEFMLERTNKDIKDFTEMLALTKTMRARSSLYRDGSIATVHSRRSIDCELYLSIAKARKAFLEDV